MQSYHRMYVDSSCTVRFTPLVDSRFSTSSERTRATHFLLAGCVLASAGLATLSWPLLPPEPSEGSAQLARPGQRFSALSLAQPATIGVTFRKPGPQGIDAPRTEALPMEALAKSKSVSAVEAEIVALAPVPITRSLVPSPQAENGTRREGDLEPVAGKPTRPTGARQDTVIGLVDGSPLSVASQIATKPAFLPSSLVEPTGQDRVTRLTVSPAQLTVRIAATDVNPLGATHAVEVPTESRPVPLDASDVTRISLSKPMPQPGLVDGSPRSRATAGEMKQALQSASLELTDQDEADRFSIVPMEMAARNAEPEAIMPVTEAPPAEMLTAGSPVQPVRPNNAHASPLLAADSPGPSAKRAIQRKVDIEQVTESAERSPQSRGPGWRDGGNMTLAAKVDAMQVPPFVLAEQELAALRTEAPVEMTVRLGGETVGKVAFRMAGTRTIEIQLAGLLDLVADRLAPGAYVRLRASAAADSFVPMHKLRAIGLSLRYDPVYDELLISA